MCCSSFTEASCAGFRRFFFNSLFRAGLTPLRFIPSVLTLLSSLFTETLRPRGTRSRRSFTRETTEWRQKEYTIGKETKDPWNIFCLGCNPLVHHFPLRFRNGAFYLCLFRSFPLVASLPRPALFIFLRGRSSEPSSLLNLNDFRILYPIRFIHRLFSWFTTKRRPSPLGTFTFFNLLPIPHSYNSPPSYTLYSNE